MSATPFDLDPNDPDIVEKANEAYDELHSPPKGEVHRPIIEPEPQPQTEPEKPPVDALKKLSDDLGVTQIREDVDGLKADMRKLMESQQQIIESQNQVVSAINGSQQQQQSQPAAPGGMPELSQMEKMQAFGEIIEKAAGIWKQFKGEPPQQSSIPGLDPQWIMNEAVEAVKDDFSLGRELRGAIKRNIKGKAVSSVVQNMSKEVSHSHEPE